MHIEKINRMATELKMLDESDSESPTASVYIDYR